MSLWCFAHFIFTVHGSSTIDKKDKEFKSLMQPRYKVYNDRLKKIVLNFGTEKEVIALLKQEENDCGNMRILRNGRLDATSELLDISANKIEVSINISGLDIDKFKERFKIIEDDFKSRGKSNNTYGGKLGIFNISRKYMQQEKSYIVIGDYEKGYRCLNVNGYVKDIENRDLKDIIILNLKNGKRIGKNIEIPKIEIKDKAWDEFNTKIDLYGANWYIQYDGKINLREPNIATNIKLDRLDGVNRLEFVDMIGRALNITSLIVRTGPRVAGNLSTFTLKKVILPDTIEVIGKRALRGTQIKEIDLKRCKNLREICYGAFSNIHTLNILEIPDTVTKIGDEVIRDSSVKYLILPRNLDKINIGMFTDAINLEILVMPDTKLELSDFIGKVRGKMPKLREIWVTQDYYESALNLGAVLNYKHMINSKVKIEIVRRKINGK